MAHDIDVLKDDARALLRGIHHRIDVLVEHVDDGFRRQAELMQAIDERHERRAVESATAHEREMQLLRDVLGNHEGRIRRLEG